MSAGHDSESDLDQAEQRLTVAVVGPRSDVVCVAVTGELDVSTAVAFHRRLSEILDGRPDQRLELDLSALAFCDLTGLRALHALGPTNGQPRCQIRIATAGPSLDLLLDLCQTPTILGYTPPPAHRDAG
ncbi:STAS domain-containing protein [Actinoplanes sp. NPDC024001]|uniref:STAS domain-containing protein n=1 Tax=Actinoplanes sp. NPDC024001 TaxID=3154598 RepID=UPI00340D2454